MPESPTRAGPFRPDVEGLRGMAILLVVLFHAAPGLMGGGYIGVDVFFVISGFLITGLLVRELEATGRVDLATFYVRRVRRLLPAMALAIGFTLLLSAMIVPPLDLSGVAGDGVSAALSVANVRFAIASGDYFGAMATPSPFLHYWSLSVEEQFYLVWPALLIVAFTIVPGRRGGPIVLALITILSLALAMAVTDMAASWAFYSLPTRAWQLALGGLVAVVVKRRLDARRHSGALAFIGWLGLVAVFVAGLTFDEWLAYPGVWALVPTLGAVAIIGAGDPRLGPGLLLRTPPLRFLGRISYALYLWHWPLLVLPAMAIGGELPLESRVGLVLLAILVATASTVMVEEPIRRSPIAANGRRQLVVAGTLGMALLFSVTIGLRAITSVTEAAMTESQGDVAALVAWDAPAADPDRPAATRDRPSGDRAAEAPMSTRPDGDASRRVARHLIDDMPQSRAGGPIVRAPAEPRDEAPRATPAPRKATTPGPRPPRDASPIIRLPTNVRPSVWDARDDEELLRRNGCLEAESATEPRRCEFGDPKGKVVVALVGDSHASHWFPALARVANRQGWRLLTFVKVSCPFTDIPVRNLQLKRTYWECGRFNESTVSALRRIQPDLVVTALLRWQYPTRTSDASAWAQGAGMARMLDRAPGRKVIIADTPFPSHDVPACLSKNLDDVRRCAVASYRRTSGDSPARERIAAERSGGVVINLAAAICGRPGTCPVVNDGMIVFRDEHHLTATFSRSLAPAVERAMLRVLHPRP